MPVARHLRMTEADKARKILQQQRRRLTRPTVNGRLRSILGDVDYYELYDQLLERQHGICAICECPPTTRRFHMDHDHDTLVIRGLLCYSCNTKLGFVEKFLLRIVEYLTKEHGVDNN